MWKRYQHTSRKQENSTLTDFTMTTDETKSNKKEPTAIVCKRTESTKRRRKNRDITYKMAIMFFIITLVFFICYIPKLIVLIIAGIDKDFVEKLFLSNSQRSAVMFVYDMFIINNIVNPYIYAFMDTKFRTEAKTLLKRVINR